MALCELRNLPAPAKINLFLHVTGRRLNGYHELQTVFQFISLFDYIDLGLRHDGQIVHQNPIEGVLPEDDLCVRAARLLKAHLGRPDLGANIRIEKNIPQGGGLGGGSSDAATTLIGLNRLWRSELPRTELARLGLQLGADVPVFVRGFNALATGVGERLKPISLPIRPLVLVQPATSVPTPAIFKAPELTRNTEALKIEGFTSEVWELMSSLPGRNDLEPVAAKYYPAVSKAISTLKALGSEVGIHPEAVRMSGSGACVFVWCKAEPDATVQEVTLVKAAKAAKIGRVHNVKTLSQHPLYKL